MALPRRSFLLALAASVGVHAAALTWTEFDFAPPREPALPPVIRVTLATVQVEPVVPQQPVARKSPVPPQAARPERVSPPAARREEPSPEPVASPLVIAPSVVEPQAPRVAVPAKAATPAPEPPPQLASVPKARASEADHVARYLHNPPPQYPWQARRMGIEGRVVLQVEILTNGNPGRVEVRQSSGHELLDQAAIKAVGGWRFDPARVAGAPIVAWAEVPITFRLTER